ncbi:Golgi SNAP receptor complex member 1-2-like isoform X7 [Primulina tabacum]|uniref:Golgi SNAP receptor complex member 1-2-like isoform X7 n=1 Tax=Primulina tabacum TaxID=48773 RepID=UPI003F594722
MDALQELGWEELRKEARRIESDLDVKLSSYAKLGARFIQGGYVDASSPTVGSSRSWKSAEMEIQSLLEKLLDINDSMSRCAASATPTTSVNQKLARHRDILHEFTQIDDVISQAQATRTALGSQRTLFGDVQGKVKLLGDKFPIIRGLLGSIRRKRSKDTLILSAVIAACTLFLIIYWLSKQRSIYFFVQRKRKKRGFLKEFSMCYFSPWQSLHLVLSV